MKTIIGMIHLSGGVEQALKEIQLYQEMGLNGALVENYHGSVTDVRETLHKTQGVFDIPLGVNILPNEHRAAIDLAEEFNLDFMQLDYVAGKYHQGSKLEGYKKPEHIHVYGGVWPKYYEPVKGSNFAADLREGMNNADSIVITGQGTGMETPLDKLAFARSIVGDKSLIVGAGVNMHNAKEQMKFADGCIIGSAFKPCGKTHQPVSRELVKELVDIIRS